MLALEQKEGENMSTSLNVTAFRDMDGEFSKMLAIKNFCDKEGVSYPKEVQEYFGIYAKESERVIRDEMLEVDTSNFVSEWSEPDEFSYGYEIDVSSIPKEVKTIRAYLS